MPSPLNCLWKARSVAKVFVQHTSKQFPSQILNDHTNLDKEPVQVDGVLVPVLVVLPEDCVGRMPIEVLRFGLLRLPEVAQLLGALLVAPLPRGLK